MPDDALRRARPITQTRPVTATISRLMQRRFLRGIAGVIGGDLIALVFILGGVERVLGRQYAVPQGFLVFVGCVLVVVNVGSVRQLLHELRVATYWEASGPLAVTGTWSGGTASYRLHIGPEQITLPANVVDRVRGTAYGTVRCTRDPDILLELCDREGNVVYRATGYHPESAPAALGRACLFAEGTFPRH